MAFSLQNLLLFLLVGSVLAVDDQPDSEDLVVVITDDNYDQLREGEWMIEFYAPWCPACNSFADTWEKFAATCKAQHPKIRVAKVDVTQETILSGRFLIQRLPTIYHGKDNDFRQFSGDRSPYALERYVREKLWEQTDPFPWYTSPMGPISGVLGYAMKGGNYLQRAYDYLTVDQGLPVWLVIAAGVLGVITTGILLGLGILFITLKFSPPARRPIHSPAGDSDIGSTGEGDEPDKKASVSDEDKGSGKQEKRKEKAAAEASPQGSPDASPRPGSKTESPHPSPRPAAAKEASPGRQGAARQRKGKKHIMKASAD